MAAPKDIRANFRNGTVVWTMTIDTARDLADELNELRTGWKDDASALWNLADELEAFARGHLAAEGT